MDPKPCRRYLLLREQEWDRLKRQAALESIDTKPKEDAERTNKLLETSQQWIKSWPDTEQGYLSILKKQLKDVHTKKVSDLLDYNHKKTDRSKEAIRNARQKIFDRSCYGQQLKSAYLESRAMEERDAQIQLKKEIYRKNREQYKADETKNTLIICDEKLNMEVRKLRDKQNAEINKLMHNMNQEQAKKDKKEERLMQLEDTRLTKALLKLEEEPNNECKEIELQATKEFEVLQMQITERRAKREQLDESLAALWRKNQDRMRLMEKQVYDQIHVDRHATIAAKKHYQLIQNLQDEETNKYNNFVDKGITTMEQRELEKQQRDTAKQEKDRQELNLLKKENKKLEELKYANRFVSTKCTCEKQSLFTSQCGNKRKKPFKSEDAASSQQPFNSAIQPTKLAALKQRETLPSPWSGTAGAHAQFAQQANNILEVCRHKAMARKVVDDYRRQHEFDSSTLPVPNYWP